MANTKKKIEAEEVKGSVENSSVSSIDENAILKAKMAEMEAQMKLMAEMISNAKSSTKETSNGKERNITFINMTNGTLNLRGSSVWKIEGQFKTRTFLEREARIIVSNMQNLIRSGLVYIADAKFVEDNDLGEAYANLLTDTQLKELLNNDSKYVIEAYKSASAPQQDIIVNMIVDKKLAGEFVDANILMVLGKACNKDLMSIEPLEAE